MINLRIDVVECGSDKCAIDRSYQDIRISNKAAKKLVKDIEIAILKASNYRYPVN